MTHLSCARRQLSSLKLEDNRISAITLMIYLVKADWPELTCLELGDDCLDDDAVKLLAHVSCQKFDTVGTSWSTSMYRTMMNWVNRLPIC